jgi:hypothetical protein
MRVLAITATTAMAAEVSKNPDQLLDPRISASMLRREAVRL